MTRAAGFFSSDFLSSGFVAAATEVPGNGVEESEEEVVVVVAEAEV